MNPHIILELSTQEEGQSSTDREILSCSYATLRVLFSTYVNVYLFYLSILYFTFPLLSLKNHLNTEIGHGATACCK